MNKVLCFLLSIFFLFCFGCANIHKASLSGEIDKVLVYIQNKGDLNVRDKKGNTPLMYAVSSKNIRLMDILISNGADVNINNKKGQTALDMAYKDNYFEGFKLVLEHGADPESMKNKAAYDLESKSAYSKLLQEYFLYNKILNNMEKNADIFDMYFSMYSNGYYRKQIEKAFKQFIKNDFDNIAAQAEKQGFDNFINTYSKMGKNYYLVTTGSLNIRNGYSTETESVGNYSRGDKVYAIDEQDDWIRTDKGWINRNYTKQVLKEIPFVHQYIEKVSKLMENKFEKPNITEEHKRPVFSQKKTIKHNPELETNAQDQPAVDTKKNSKPTAIQKELDSVLADASMKALEDFIQKYKNNAEYASFVETARKKYKSILLGN
ncbi:ankyrin repeat domain-containing protein [Desulfonema limicola]|nr:ankyrin repeat domain-containing protein [Desulfonema limicola]